MSPTILWRSRQSAVWRKINSPMRARICNGILLQQRDGRQRGGDAKPDCRRTSRRARRASNPSRSAFAIMAQSGMPDAIPFAVQMMSGSMPAWSTAHHFPVRPIPDCTSSATSRIPCLRQRRSSPCRNSGGAGEVAALALNRLDENRGHFRGIDEALEKFVLNVRQANRPRRFPDARRKRRDRYSDREHEILRRAASRSLSAARLCSR